jgi:hypothetical protein
MISLLQDTRDLLGISFQAAFIDNDLGAMGDMVSYLLRQETWNAATTCNTLNKPKLPAMPVALKLAKPGP